MNQGDIYNEKKLEREVLKEATFDRVRNIPPQVWYDQLRGSDDGRYSQISVTKENIRIKSSDIMKKNNYFK